MNLEQLKQVADKVQYTYHHMIGVKKLEEGLEEHCKELGTTIEEVAKEMNLTEENADTPVEEVVEATPTPKKTTRKPTIDLSRMTFADAEKVTKVKNTAEKTKEAMRLIRCIITSNNKNKTSYQGEIFTARNAFLPEVKKMVPFGVPTHVPKILFNMIKEKLYQQYRSVKHPNGMVTKTSYLTPEYNIQLLDPLTTDEFEAIKKKQLAEGFNGE